ncbi:MAG: serine O-acetyltransferase [Verrucomicrobiae bacterium]|nr:serine O-acetyltransferase [Verrucomicrobiae bacterium]
MKYKFDQIVQDLFDSYRTIGGINHIDGVNLPSKQSVAEITQDLLHLMFPGFFDPGEFHEKNCQQNILRRLNSLSKTLKVETRKSLQYAAPKGARTRDLEEQADELILKFFASLPAVRKMLKHDVIAAYEGDPAAVSLEEIILAYPYIEAIAVQRLAHVLHREGLPLLPRMMTEWAHSRTGIDIHPGTSVGMNFFIDHGTGVVIGETALIGNNVKIYQGVTLGAKSFKKDETGRIVKGGRRHPTIEDDVTIYSNATILGGETVVGAGTTIGGNVFLVESVPPQSIVTQEGQKLVIKKKNQGTKVDFQI